MPVDNLLYVHLSTVPSRQIGRELLTFSTETIWSSHGAHLLTIVRNVQGDPSWSEASIDGFGEGVPELNHPCD